MVNDFNFSIAIAGIPLTGIILMDAPGPQIWLIQETLSGDGHFHPKISMTFTEDTGCLVARKHFRICSFTKGPPPK